MAAGTSTHDEKNEAELLAAWNFAYYFHNKYIGQKYLQFQKFTTLKKALTMDKIVILFLHFNDDHVLDRFNDCLQSPKIWKLLKSTCLLLGWDMTDVDCNTSLIDTLNEQYDLDNNCLDFATFQTSVAVLFTSKDNYKLISNKMLTEMDLQDIIGEAIRTAEIKFSSTDFHQYMMDNFENGKDLLELERVKQKINCAFTVCNLFGTNEKEEERKRKKIEEVLQLITKQYEAISNNRGCIEILIIFNVTEPLADVKKKRQKKNSNYNPRSDIMAKPVFVLAKCQKSEDPCRIFIDVEGRVYDTWKDYLKNNKLRRCKMVFPTNGRYEANKMGNVIIKKRTSPDGSINSLIWNITGCVGSIASIVGVVGLFVATPIVVPVAGGIAGGVTIAQASAAIHDLRIHKQDLRPSNPEALKQYANLILSSCTVLMSAVSGATACLSKLAKLTKLTWLSPAAKQAEAVMESITKVQSLFDVACGGINATLNSMPTEQPEGINKVKESSKAEDMEETQCKVCNGYFYKCKSN